MAILDELIRCIDTEGEDSPRAYELVGELTETQDRSLSPDLVNALRKYVMARNPFGRNMIASAYAEIEGFDALTILLRASSVEMGNEEDHETLQSIIVDIISIDPSRALKVIDELEADPNPRIKAVASWGREMVAFVAED